MLTLAPPTLHDGTILSLSCADGNAVVVVCGSDNLEVLLRFGGVFAIKDHRCVGMFLYAIAEMKHPGKLRRFVFVNSDGDDDAVLEITAEDFQVK